MYLFIETPVFAKNCSNYLDDDDYAKLQAHLNEAPNSGDVVPGTGGVRKLRWARAGMGKRGGLRVIYYVQDDLGRIWLLTLYGKSAQDNISNKTLRLMREVADNAEII